MTKKRMTLKINAENGDIILKEDVVKTACKAVGIKGTTSHTKAGILISIKDNDYYDASPKYFSAILHEAYNKLGKVTVFIIDELYKYTLHVIGHQEHPDVESFREEALELGENWFRNNLEAFLTLPALNEEGLVVSESVIDRIKKYLLETKKIIIADLNNLLVYFKTLSVNEQIELINTCLGDKVEILRWEPMLAQFYGFMCYSRSKKQAFTERRYLAELKEKFNKMLSDDPVFPEVTDTAAIEYVNKHAQNMGSDIGSLNVKSSAIYLAEESNVLALLTVGRVVDLLFYPGKKPKPIEEAEKVLTGEYHYIIKEGDIDCSRQKPTAEWVNVADRFSIRRKVNFKKQQKENEKQEQKIRPLTPISPKVNSNYSSSSKDYAAENNLSINVDPTLSASLSIPTSPDKFDKQLADSPPKLGTPPQVDHNQYLQNPIAVPAQNNYVESSLNSFVLSPAHMQMFTLAISDLDPQQRAIFFHQLLVLGGGGILPPINPNNHKPFPASSSTSNGDSSVYSSCPSSHWYHSQMTAKRVNKKLLPEDNHDFHPTN